MLLWECAFLKVFNSAGVTTKHFRSLQVPREHLRVYHFDLETHGFERMSVEIAVTVPCEPRPGPPRHCLITQSPLVHFTLPSKKWNFKSLLILSLLPFVMITEDLRIPFHSFAFLCFALTDVTLKCFEIYYNWKLCL